MDQKYEVQSTKKCRMMDVVVAIRKDEWEWGDIVYSEISRTREHENTLFLKGIVFTNDLVFSCSRILVFSNPTIK